MASKLKHTLCVKASTAVSAMGSGTVEMYTSLKERKCGLRRCDFTDVALDGWIGRVDGLENYTIPSSMVQFDCRNNRLAAAALELDGFVASVEKAKRRYGAERIAVILGTTTSGVLTTEEAYKQRDPTTGALPIIDFEHTHDYYSLSRFVRELLQLRGPALTVSTACASSAKTFIDAYHLIGSGICDAAVVGGVDSLCRMTLRGFAALDLVSPYPCRPCDEFRDGISVGEAAGFALLERNSDGLQLLGFGATSDGFHMSSPHPRGAGAIGAMQEALLRSQLSPTDIDYVHLHGTGTKANDFMEDLAVTVVFGASTPCSSTKGWCGHTLASSGIMQVVIGALCIERGFIPGSLNVKSVDPSFTSKIVVANQEQPVRRFMSNSFGFGGINCSLVFGEMT